MSTKIIKHFFTILATAAITLAGAADLVYADLKDNNNGTITDTATGLVWLKNANCFDWERWERAMNFAAGLSSGACGLSDKSTAGQWRLPTIEELKVRATDKTGFTNVQSFSYWSSTTYTGSPEKALGVLMDRGHAIPCNKFTFYNYVWPVRAGQ